MSFVFECHLYISDKNSKKRVPPPMNSHAGQGYQAGVQLCLASYHPTCAWCCRARFSVPGIVSALLKRRRKWSEVLSGRRWQQFRFHNFFWSAARFFQFFFFLIILWCIGFQVSYSVYQFIGGENDSTFILSDHNNTICSKHLVKKCHITNPLSNWRLMSRFQILRRQKKNGL